MGNITLKIAKQAKIKLKAKPGTLNTKTHPAKIDA